jgi:hypothetical protein
MAPEPDAVTRPAEGAQAENALWLLAQLPPEVQRKVRRRFALRLEPSDVPSARYRRELSYIGKLLRDMERDPGWEFRVYRSEALRRVAGDRQPRHRRLALERGAGHALRLLARGLLSRVPAAGRNREPEPVPEAEGRQEVSEIHVLGDRHCSSPVRRRARPGSVLERLQALVDDCAPPNKGCSLPKPPIDHTALPAARRLVRRARGCSPDRTAGQHGSRLALAQERST